MLGRNVKVEGGAWGRRGGVCLVGTSRLRAGLGGGEGGMLGRNVKVEGGAWGRRGGYAQHVWSYSITPNFEVHNFQLLRICRKPQE